jgi:hypothetical protein
LGAASLLDSSTGGAGDGAVASRRAEAVKESSNPPATAGTCKPRHALTDISGSRRISESRG